MFKGFYGMKDNPFTKQIREEQSYGSRDFIEMTNRLNRLKDIRGIGVFTAPPGGGKTFALRCFVKALNPSLFQSAYIAMSTVSVTEFYSQLCAVLGIDASQRKSTMFRNIQHRVLAMFKEQRKPLFLAVDEAHELDSRILKDLKMITNHSYDSIDSFALILLGEPHLNHILQKPTHEALRQRITIHYNFAGLSPDETEKYVRHKLTSVGAAETIIGEGVLSAVCGYAHGNPRMIDNVMSDALTFGAQHNMRVLDTEAILAAINNQELE